jgi:isopentenyl-diphosphate delta-isomerase
LSDQLILVDRNDNIVGHEEKDKCHIIPALLHRAFSIFIINAEGHMLIHKRSALKKTWPGFWTNACCSHPRKDETLEMATKRRLREELGITADLKPLFTFQYEAPFDEEYGENEVDHVFIGMHDGPITADPAEIEAWRFMNIHDLAADVKARPEKYTPWFALALPRVLDTLDREFEI